MLADVFNMQNKDTGIVYSVPRIVEEVNFEMRTYNDYYRSKSQMKKLASKKKKTSAF